MKLYRSLPGLPGLALSCAALLAAPTLRAEPRAEASTTSLPRSELSRSERLIEQGMALRQSGQEEAALGVFEEAAALEPESIRARVHLAATHQALGHWAEADALLEEVLTSESDDPYLERHRATLERAAEFVGRHLGSLMLSGQPAGAEVRLDGRKLGVLPLPETMRVPVGSYQLEVLSEGYYPLRRPLVISSQAVLRESVTLAPLAVNSGAASAGGNGSAGDEPASASAGSPLWLSWTLTGLSAGAAITTGVAFAVRNHHASEWNSAECLQPGRVRGEVCGDELDAGKTAETVAYASGVATLLFAAGAVVSWTLGEPASSEAPTSTSRSASKTVARTRCGVTLGGGTCFGSF